jgi:hypothetical protein
MDDAALVAHGSDYVSKQQSEQPAGKLATPSQRRYHRVVQATVLLLSSALAFGSNFCYHNPAALKNQLQQHFSYTVEKNEFEMLFVRGQKPTLSCTIGCMSSRCCQTEHALHALLDAQCRATVSWWFPRRSHWRAADAAAAHELCADRPVHHGVWLHHLELPLDVGQSSSVFDPCFDSLLNRGCCVLDWANHLWLWRRESRRRTDNVHFHVVQEARSR